MSPRAKRAPRGAERPTGRAASSVEAATAVAPEPEGECLRRLGPALSEGVAGVRSGRVVWANDRLVALSGRPAARDLVGLPFAELFKDTGRGLPDPHGGRAL